MLTDIQEFVRQRTIILESIFTKNYPEAEKADIARMARENIIFELQGGERKKPTGKKPIIDHLIEIRQKLSEKGLGSLEENFSRIKQTLPELREQDHSKHQRRTDLNLIIDELEKLIR